MIDHPDVGGRDRVERSEVEPAQPQDGMPPPAEELHERLAQCVVVLDHHDPQDGW